jgi:hypothetical protein
MRRTIAILVLGIILLSIMSVGVLADRDSGRAKGSVNLETRASVNSGDAADTTAKVETETNIKDGELETKTETRVKGVSEFAKTLKESSQKFRDSLRSAKTKEERVQIIKERRDELKAGFEDARTKFRASKEELKVCKGKQDLKCKNLRVKYRANTLPFLLSTADAMAEYLERVRVKISESNLENKVELLARIDARISKLDKIKDEIESLGENPSREDLKKAADALKAELKEVKASGRNAAVHSLADRMGGVLVKAAHLEARLDKTLLKLKTKDVDISTADTKVAEFKQHIEDAKKIHAEAKAKLIGGASPSDVHSLIKSAHEHLKLAHQALKEAVRQIKNIKDGEDALEEAIIETQDEDAGISDSEQVSTTTGEQTASEAEADASTPSSEQSASDSTAVTSPENINSGETSSETGAAV